MATLPRLFKVGDAFPLELFLNLFEIFFNTFIE